MTMTTEELNALQIAKNQLAEALARNRDLVAGFEYVAKRLLEEATERNWCEEYNDFVEDVNNHIDVGPKLLPAESEWDVTISYSGSFQVRVKARDENEAERLARLFSKDSKIAEVRRDAPYAYFDVEEAERA